MVDVKTLFVRLKSEGAAEVKAQLDAIAAKADQLSRENPELKVRIDTAAATAKMMLLRAELRGVARDAAAASTGDAAAASTGDGGGLRGLAAAVSNVTAMLGGGGTAGGGGLTGGLAALGPLLGAMAVAGAAVVTTALFPMLATIPLIAVGIGTFAAVAIPSLAKVWAAIHGGAAAWRALTPAEKEAAAQIKELQEGFLKLTNAVQPMVITAFAQAVRILNSLMPALSLLARAAGQALDTLLKNISHWLDSSSGKKFIAWMERDGPHAIMIFGKALWDIAQVAGRVFSFLNNEGETMQRRLAANFHGIAVAFDDLRRFFAVAGHDIAHSFDDVRRAIAIAGHDIAVAFDFVRHGIATLAATFAMNVAGMIRTVAHWAAEVGHWVMDAVRWFQRLPGMIVSAVGNLGSLLWNAGKSLIDGLIAGIKSAIPGLSSVLGWLKSLIPSWKGPLAEDLRLLYPHGQAIMTGLIGGIQSRVPDLEAQMRQVTAVAGRPGYGGGYGGGPIVFEFHGSGTGLDNLFWTWFQKGVRTKGGDPAIVTRKVVFR